MIRRPPRSTQSRSSAASDVYKRQVNNVYFTPRSRTYWHTHEVGQILQVIAGSGFVVTRDGHSEVIRTGDIAFIPAGEEHWHGGSPESFLLHTATSIGKTSWL